MSIKSNTRHRVLLTTVVLALAACGKPEQAPPAPPPTVVVSTVTAADVPIVFPVSGTVQGTRQVEIKPRVSGTIETLLLHEGQPVKTGDPLYQIDPRPFQAQLDAAMAQLAVDQANLEFADSEVKRYTDLAKQGAGSVERKEDTEKSQKQATAAIAKDQADIEQAKLNLGYTRITAPFDGVVQATRVYTGAVVTAQQTTLTELVTLDPVYVVFNISRSDAYKFEQLRAKGLAATDLRQITVAYDLPDGSRSPIEGYMDFRGTQLDPSTDTFKGRAIFDNPGSDDQRKLLPGQYVPLYLTVGHRPDTQLIPQAALLQTQEGSYVWVIDEHDTAQRRVVTIGPAYQGYWMVREGLKTGERVVSEGVQKIRKSGMPVRVGEATATENH